MPKDAEQRLPSHARSRCLRGGTRNASCSQERRVHNIDRLRHCERVHIDLDGQQRDEFSVLWDSSSNSCQFIFIQSSWRATWSGCSSFSRHDHLLAMLNNEWMICSTASSQRRRCWWIRSNSSPVVKNISSTWCPRTSVVLPRSSFIELVGWLVAKLKECGRGLNERSREEEVGW